MSSNTLLEVQGLGKTFRVYQRNRDRLLALFSRKPRCRNFRALDNISFNLAPGKVMGIIGENGSGKSTLLKLIVGVLLPDEGQICSHGKITGLLELGTGFNPELSGRQNIYLNGMYLNMTARELDRHADAIIDFSGLEQCIDEPLKNYSSGMAMRLAFSVAIQAQPRCFLIDEALSVGDIRFQQKCFDRLRSFQKSGGSILFVSHDMNAVKLLCDESMLLHHGRMLFHGEPDDTVNAYNELMAGLGESGKNTETGYGNAAVRFTSASVLDGEGKPCEVLTSGQPATVRFTWTCRQPVDQLTFGITIRDRFGQDVFGTNGALLHKLADIRADGAGAFHFREMNIGRGVYTINLAAHTGTTHLDNCYHWWDNAAVFEVAHAVDGYFGGHTRLDCSLELDGQPDG